MTDLVRAERFSSEWLALREPVDHRSRALGLIRLLRAGWSENGWTRVLDLGSGTGSNLRYLAPRLPGIQEWTLLDHDAELLASVDVGKLPCEVRCVQGELRDEGLAEIAQADLVTCSALLDLIPEGLLTRLVRACCSAACGAYFTLTYDGLIRWSTSTGDATDSNDTMVQEAIKAHQQRDRGAASALGPAASVVVSELFKAGGYQTWVLPSPWRLGPDDFSLVRGLLEGWERAAQEISERPEEFGRIRAWAEHRRWTTTRSDWGLTVGHQDLLALPQAVASSGRSQSASVLTG